MQKQRFCIDTTAITDTEVRSSLGVDSISESTKIMLDLIADSRVNLGISCHIPYPSVYDELIGFLKRENCPKETIIKVDTWLVKKTPNRYEIKLPAELLYEYIRDIRERINKGMRIGENAMYESASVSYLSIKGRNSNQNDNIKNTKNVDTNATHKEHTDEVLSKTVKSFRNKYRTALRTGTLDSAPDLDVLLLAKELDAAVVASDEGIEKWAQRLGLRFVKAKDFPFILKEYLNVYKI
ncbi:RNA ligase partner protein [Methanococcus aeolicus]|uniref:RNA ligase partner protein n=1 Tax=Methanococcus aeolicus TaxID=42879 RepID=UPI0021C740AB|nr:RNA ligase partner protein [Methanococcus aeolicus]UXM84534.1 RNA ligase partner protein [Methanococcus aeolicus]